MSDNIYVTKKIHEKNELENSILKEKYLITLDSKIQEEFFVSKREEVPILFENRYFADMD